ncbi:MAG: Tol-Pal system protein TolB [Verrucomicrobia bacterium]|nr:Tol-Pal system protein TolB [Verrucomicrobiota bacterium]
MRKNIHLLLLFVIINLLVGANEIRVELATQAKLADLQIQKGDSPYLNRLIAVLEFDLGHSGYFKFSESANGYVLKLTQNENKLNVQVLHKDNLVKKLDGIAITDDFHTDRRQMHKLSDAILHTLFGAKGINDTRILYSLKPSNEYKAEIWECDWDGANAKQVTQENNYSIHPVFTTAHNYLYVNYKNGQPKIYASNLKHSTGKPLIELRGNQLLPAISKQRDKLAFISDATGRADLFIQKLDASGMLVDKPQQLFSYPGATQASPTFSPDGSKIAFVSDKDGTPRIYIIPSELTHNKRAKPILLTKLNRENTCPCWSADGKKIAYSAKTNGVRQIWIYDFETEQELQLTTGPGNKENPCWAPDSLHLVFNSTDPDSTELYLVNLNQPEAVQITKGPGKKHYPTWGIK